MTIAQVSCVLLATAAAIFSSAYAATTNQHRSDSSVPHNLAVGAMPGASYAATTEAPKVSCSTDTVSIVHLDRIYVGHAAGGTGGCVTLTDIYNSFLEADGSTKGPLFVLDGNDNVVNEPGQTTTGRWLLRSDLYVEDDVTLVVWGTGFGGDADVLRLESTYSHYYNLRGYGGSLSFFHTVVTSWDTRSGAVRETYKKGRAYVSCVSEKLTGETCSGCAQKDKGECRMDVISSEMGYLGYPASESYGLSWKVRGFCSDLSNEDLFEKVNVYGDIKNSNIHDNYYGMYSYGHQGGNWTNNHMHHNHQYGFDPHDDSDYLTISFNKVYNNVNHGIIASKRCNNLDIHDNEVYDGQQVGIFLHRSSDFSKVYNNYVHGNGDAGMALMETMDSEVYDNKFINNRFGVRITMGGAGNSIHDNIFDSCSSYGLMTYKGADKRMASNGRPSDNAFFNNVISNTKLGTKFFDGDDNMVYGNTFTGTEKFRFDHTKGTLMKDNDYPSGACMDAYASSFTSDSEVPDDC